jgi:hypothetical protein
MKFKISKVEVRGDIVNKAISSPKAAKKIFNSAKQKFKKAKKELIQEFDAHPITKEIENPDQGNRSGTLQGYSDKSGNKPDLYGFIGFEQGKNPTQTVREFLKQNIEIKDVKLVRGYGRRLPKIRIRYNIPSIHDFSKVNDADPVVTSNWVKSMERGLKGLNRYRVISGKGRSLRGIQFKGNLRYSLFKNKKYMSAMLNNFKRKISKFS